MIYFLYLCQVSCQYGLLTKGHNSIKAVGGVIVLTGYHCFIFVPKFAKMSQRVSELLSLFNSVKAVGRVTVLNFCTLSDDRCFIFVPKFAKISQRVSELMIRFDLQTEIYKGA